MVCALSVMRSIHVYTALVVALLLPAAARAQGAPGTPVLNTGMGALIGAGVDALHRGRTTIYSKPAPSPRPAASARPRVLFKLRF
jgi:hypothetical protein